METKIAMQWYMQQIKENVADNVGIVKIVVDILENPVLFNFSEFLELNEIKQLMSSEFRCYYNALKLFSIGTFREYAENLADLIPLTPEMEKKLKLLSILTMATESKSIPYDDLLAELGFKDVRHLEDLIIEAVYAELIVARLDQKNRRIEIDSALARDFQPLDIQSMIETFEQWLEASAKTASCIKELIDKANAEKAEKAKLRDSKESQLTKFIKKMQVDDGPQSLVIDDPEYNKKVERLREQIKQHASTSTGASGSMLSPGVKCLN